jgi:oxygen-independent coproporphyrinogen III oxidase
VSARERLHQAIAGQELPVYVYSYPSKRAYRPLGAALTLERIWESTRGPLNLYVHVPFCGYRCSFCTLFLTTVHSAEARQRYVDSLVEQIRVYGALLPEVEIASVYFGGGTPSVLETRQFEQIFGSLQRAFPSWSADAEVTVEGSPDTLTPELLGAVKSLGVNRISMGVQTLDPEEARLVGRRYALSTVHATAEAIRATGFANVNYDLIYGLEGQTRTTWLASLAATVGLGPETVTVYPVVVRPLTAIEKRRAKRSEAFGSSSSLYALYDETTAFLAQQGFRQNTFVRFSKCWHDGLRQEVSDFSGVPLLGLGAGARSYTRRVHYGTDFAVRRRPTEAIIQSYSEKKHDPSEVPSLGFVLSDDEERRRWCVLSLSLGTLDRARYRETFGREAGDDFAEELGALETERCVETHASGYRLTPLGFKYSNAIGELFKSVEVDALEQAFVPQ